MLFLSRERETDQRSWEDEWSQIQSNPREKPVTVRKRLVIEVGVHLAGQRQLNIHRQLQWCV